MRGAPRVGAVLLLLVAALPALLGPGRGYHAISLLPASASERVAACERAHHIGGATAWRRGPATTVFASCSWPARAGAEDDGYVEIISSQDSGPGLDESSGLDQADRITGPCAKYQLIYRYFAQGETDRVGLIAQRGIVTSVYPNAPTAVGPLPFDPQPGELDVLRSGRYTLDTATCHG
jgi:hypothetical protein